MPLDASPARTAAIAYIGQGANAGTSLAISNASASSANVTVKAFNTNGTAAGTRSVTLAANAQAGDTLANLIPAAASLTTGFVTITSDQPITAAAMLSSGPEVGFLPAQPVSFAPSGGGGGPAPQISAGGIGNAANYAPKLVRGGLATIFGSNFAAGSNSGQATTLPLSYVLANVSVTVGGIPAPLIFVNANQINFQVPFEVPAGSSAAVIVTANGVASPSVFVQMADYGVGVFTYARTASAIDPIVVHYSTNQIVTPANPATPNEVLVVYATGVGKLSNPPATGAGAPGGPLAAAVDNPTIAVGGLTVNTLFAGLTPGLVGLIQFNIQLPANLPSGNLPLIVQFPGDSSPSVNLAVAGNVAGSPTLSLSASSLAFGNVTVGQTKDLPVVVSNTGSALLSGTAALTGTGFNLVGGTAISVQPGASQALTVRFAPGSAGAVAGTLKITSNDASSPATVTLSGTGVTIAVPVVAVSATSLDFGTVTVNQTKDLVVQVQNTGTAALTVSSATSSNARFTVTSPSGSFSVNAGSSQSVTVRFAPTAVGAQAGTLTLATNDPAHPSVTLALTGTGGASGPVTTILQVDSGTYDTTVGFPSGNVTAYFVNRLTPPSYPSTLRSVQIVVPASQIPTGTAITILAATNTSGVGGAQLSGLTFQRTSAQANGFDQILDFPIAPITIPSGDFVVGFSLLNPNGAYPAALDTASASRQRSYVSGNGTAFSLVDSTVIGPGNLVIRAKVDAPSGDAARDPAIPQE
jgi:uncharacterized protein (TIGR03437 family)